MPGRHRSQKAIMNLTDTEESEYIGNGAGTPRQPRGNPCRTFCISHLLRDESVSGNLRNFHGRASPARTRFFERASSVSLLGFSGPPLTTVGGALFCRPGHSSTEGKTEGHRRQRLENSLKRGWAEAGDAGVSSAKHSDWTTVAKWEGVRSRSPWRVGTRAFPVHSLHPTIHELSHGTPIGSTTAPHGYRGLIPRAHFAARSRQTCPAAPHQRPCMQRWCAFPRMLFIHGQGAEHDQ